MAKDEQAIENQEIGLMREAEASAFFRMEDLVAAGAAMTKPFLVDGVEAVMVPKSFNLHKFDDARSRPQRLKQHVICHDAASFVDYVSTWRAPQSLVTIDLEELVFAGVIDYHEPCFEDSSLPACDPRWLAHTVTFTPRKTAEWQIWTTSDGRWMSQDDFAEFIEVNGDDIVKPEAARLFEIVTQFKATKGVKFRSAKNLDDGSVNLQYDETVEASGGNGKTLKVPPEIQIGISPFQGAAAYKIDARFQFRINENKLTMRYALKRPHLVWRNAGEKVAADIRKELDAVPDVKVINGVLGQ